MEALLKMGVELARDNFINKGHVDVLFIGESNSGRFMLPGLFNDEEEKGIFLKLAKVCFQDYDVERYVFMSETWYVSRSEKQGICTPSEQADKQEALLVAYVDKSKVESVFLPIIRKDNKFEKFGEPLYQQGRSITGRFCELLSDEPTHPPETLKKAAMAYKHHYGTTLH